MPIPELMTWVPSRRRWTRMHKGKRYWISCKKLGVPESKEGSIHAANAYWKAKQAELDALPRPKAQVSLEDIAVAVLGKKQGETLELKDILRLYRLRNAEREREEERREKAQELYEIDELTPGEPDAGRRELSKYVALQLVEYLLEEGVIPESVARHLPPARVAQLEGSVKGLRGESDTPAERSIRANVDAWLTTQQARAAAGSIAPDRYTNVRMMLAHFVAFLGESADVSIIDGDKLEGFYRHCLGQVAARRQDPKKKAGWAESTAKETFAVARTWIKWLWEKEVLEVPPRKLDSKTFRFGSSSRKVPTWTNEEVRRVITAASGKLKLALLLMVNCGMTQADVSDLLDEEVRWSEGRIVRQRSKTKNRENVPTVDYKLWPSTFKLLKKYRSGTERVLLTESGRPYVRKDLVNGELVKADGFTSNYKRLQLRLKFKKPMKQLRKTAASLLESHETFGRLTSLFLGHSPRSMKDKHYAAPPQELLDAGVLWLGEKLGLLDQEEERVPGLPQQSSTRTPPRRGARTRRATTS